MRTIAIACGPRNGIGAGRCGPKLPAGALAVATSAPVDAFGLTDWGHITPSRRAELLLVEGDLVSDSTATSPSIGVWRHDHRVDRVADQAALITTDDN